MGRANWVLRVWLIDDHELIREGLRILVEKKSMHFVVRESGTLAEAADAAPAATCDIVLLDLTLPDGDGIPFIKVLRKMRPDLPILALTMHSTQERVLGALEAGASGYLVKSASEEDLLSAIETVGNGGTYIHSAVTPYVLQSFREVRKSSVASRWAKVKGSPVGSPAVLCRPSWIHSVNWGLLGLQLVGSYPRHRP